MRYLIDADVLIQAKNAHYPFDVCPGFWDWLESANTYQRVFSVAKIREELLAGSDELAEWARQRESFFLAVDEEVTASLRDVASWATTVEPKYDASAVTEFLGSGDYYLIAHARAKGYTVVTAEVAADTVRKVKIPNACLGVAVEYTDVFTMLRTEGARFVMA